MSSNAYRRLAAAARVVLFVIGFSVAVIFGIVGVALDKVIKLVQRICNRPTGA